MQGSIRRCPSCKKTAVYPEQKHCGDDGERLIQETMPGTQIPLKARSYATEAGILTTVTNRHGDLTTVLKHPEDFCPNCSDKEKTAGGHDALPGMQPGGSAANVFTLVSMSLGVGVFVLPVACAKVGMVLGVACVIACGLLSDFVMQCIIRTSLATGATTFEGLSYRAFGMGGPPLVAIAIAMSAFTGNASHMNFVALTAWDVIQYGCYKDVTDISITKMQMTIVLVALAAFALPLCLSKSLGGLRYLASFSVMWVIFTVTVVLFYATRHLVENGIAKDLPLYTTDIGEISRLITQVLFAFSSMMTIFPVIAETPDKRQTIRDTHIANIIITVCYTLVAVICGLAYGTEAGATVLSYFPLSIPIFLVLKIGLAVCLTGLYPVVNFPMILSLNALIFPKRGFVSNPVRFVVSVIGYILIILLIVVVGRLGVVFGLCGGLGIGSCAYWLPAAVVLGIILRRMPATHLMSAEDAGVLNNLVASEGNSGADGEGRSPVTFFTKKRLVATLAGATVAGRDGAEYHAAEEGLPLVGGHSAPSVNSGTGAHTSGRVLAAHPSKSVAFLEARDVLQSGMPSRSGFASEPFPGSGPAHPLAGRSTRIYADGVELAAHHGERMSYASPVVWIAIFTVIMGVYAAGFSCYDAVASALVPDEAPSHVSVTAIPPLAPSTSTPVAFANVHSIITGHSAGDVISASAVLDVLAPTAVGGAELS